MKPAFIRFSFSKHSRYCIIGGGTGGLSITSHLLRSRIPSSQIRVIDPSPNHYYQPGWSMVGAGLWQIHSTSRKMQDVFPGQIKVLRDRVKLIKPTENTVLCESGDEYTYDQLIISTGLQLQYWKVQGLKQALDDPSSKVGCIYELGYAQKVARLGQKMKSGRAIFTEPVHPLKCAGAPQKIMYLWADKWGKKKLPIQIEFYKTNAIMFSVPKYSKALEVVAANYGIKTTFKHALVKVQGNQAFFQNIESKEKELVIRQFDFLHAVPPMGPHAYINESGLADETGYLYCDKQTLRHKKYSNIWGIGDCTNLPCSKTAAAVFSQTKELHDNLLALRKNPAAAVLPGRYSGYASCPLLVGKMKVVLAEFKYNEEIDQTFYNDQQKPRFQFYILKRFLLPLSYWFLVPRGMWAGRKGIRWT